MEFKDKRRWYLVQCKPGESFRALAHLENQGYVCFHPTHPVKRKVRGEIQIRIDALFPHYLFVLLDKNDNWGPLRSTRGVNCLVRFNGVPASLSEQQIENLRQLCATFYQKQEAPLYQVGDRVVIQDTCFKDLEAIITATKGDERVILLLNLCNQTQHIEFPTTAITLVQ